MTHHPTRRHLLLGAGTLAAGLAAPALPRAQDATDAALPVPGGALPSALEPALVVIGPGFPQGEIHVDPDSYALFWTLGEDTAIRYPCGIGRGELYHAGEFFVGAKKEWPSWTPTPEMIAREPELYEPYAGGMPGGIDNPLGARALYLFTPEQGDTFLRIHGTNASETIGTAVSNGCARLVNEQIIDLYQRVPLDTRVVLYPKGGAVPA